MPRRPTPRSARPDPLAVGRTAVRRTALGRTESCHSAGPHSSGAPFQTWHEDGRAFLAVRGEERFTICDDRHWCYGEWSDLAEFRQRYAQGDLAVWVGRGVMTSVQLRVLECCPYSLEIQRAAVRAPGFLALRADQQLRVLGHLAGFAFDWERAGISVESACERALQTVLEAST